MLRSILFSCLFLFNTVIVHSQHGTGWVDLSGKVLNKLLESPLQATIVLESMPYGADNRVFKSEGTTGEFTFKVQNEKEYKVTVTAEGYADITETVLISPKIGTLLFEMIPTGAGSLLNLNINFNQGKSKILKDSYQELDKLLNMLNEYPSMVIQLEGHTDFRGSASANLRLSEDRVQSVKKYLIDKKIAAERIKTKAFGGSMPISKENSAEAKLMNRRVQARILQSE